jgi:Protein of unknown function (DUF3800)
MARYRLYLDEVGNDDIGNVADDRYRYLSLTGVIIQHDYARDVAGPRLEELKREIFCQDPDEAVILHRKDIFQRKGIFGKLNDIALCARFDAAIISYLTEIDYVVITVFIDKKGMMNQTHWNNKHPYHYLMEILVEKYVQWLERHNGDGDVMPEMRRGKKDAALQKAFNYVQRWGSYYVNSTRVRARLPGNKLKFRAKYENISGLQICDLLAHPSHMDIRLRKGHRVNIGTFSQQIIPILGGSKYDRSYAGGIVGYGIKYLP